MTCLKAVALMLLCLALSIVAPHTAQAAQANQSTDSCKGFIETVPTTISAPGTWCFSSDLATDISSGFAVYIAASRVTIDCRGFTLDGSSAATGIYAGAREAITVRNCNIHGFDTGILIVDGGNHVVVDNRLENNTDYGIYVDNKFGPSHRSLIERNEIVNTGLGDSDAIGILFSDGVRVIDNIVSGVHAGSATGILAIEGDFGEVVGNLVSGLDATGGPGIATGIFSLGSEGMRISENVFEGDRSPGSVGVECFGPADVANNTIAYFEKAIVGCRDRGDNVVIP